MECRGTQLSGTACKDREVTTGTDCNNGASAKDPANFQGKIGGTFENWNDFMKDFGCRFCTKAL